MTLSSQIQHVTRVPTNLLVIVVVVCQSTSIGHDLLSEGGLGGDVTFKVGFQSGDSREQKSESAELQI